VKWNRLLLNASLKLGASLDSARHYKRQLVDTGFVNVTQVEYKWLINSWPKDEKYKTIGGLFFCTSKFESTQRIFESIWVRELK